MMQKKWFGVAVLAAACLAGGVCITYAVEAEKEVSADEAAYELLRGKSGEKKPGSPGASAEESVYGIKIIDFDKSEVFLHLTKSEMTEMENLLAIEARLIRKAYDEAQKQWKMAEETKNIYFPLSVPAPRRMGKLGRYMSSEEAEDKINALRQKAKEKREDEKTQEREEYEGQLGRRLQVFDGVPNSSRQREKARKEFEEEYKSKQAKEQQREMITAQALALFREKLNALTDKARR